ncbi:MAG TPA: hypothetical protein PLG33_05455 [Prolixibacteraceae bacterium]|nr:hypothetical protein [Prolixibacteraceae bacterium]
MKQKRKTENRKQLKEEVMKTIKSFIIICALCLVGVSNVKATVNHELKDSKLTSASQILAELNNRITFVDTEFSESIDYQKEAQLVTKWLADQAEAKVTRQLIERNEGVESSTNIDRECLSANDITDFRKEAQLVTKSVADKEEALVLQKLVNEGRITENR